MKIARVIAGALALMVADACSGTTGGERVTFDAEAAGTEVGTFVNDKGWSLTLARAKVTLGPLYLNVIAPLGQSASVFGIRSAHAHGESHLEGGRIVGEVLGQVTFDALSAAPVPFVVRGVAETELVRTAEICFYPRPGAPPEGDGTVPSLDLEGRAERGGSVVRFRGALILDRAWLEPGNTLAASRVARGVRASFAPREGGKLRVRIDPRALFRGADFSALEPLPREPDGTYLLQPRDPVLTVIRENLRASAGTFEVSFSQTTP